ncbi:hypothetical protein A2U01_0076799, partial [Trifolium medium]|nr:hypothetical protein [Trifolium medium]
AHEVGKGCGCIEIKSIHTKEFSFRKELPLHFFRSRLLSLMPYVTGLNLLLPLTSVNDLLSIKHIPFVHPMSVPRLLSGIERSKS